MTDRIAPPEDLEYILDDLKSEGIFDTKQKALMFAAAVGFARRETQPPEAPESLGEGIKLDYFARPKDLPFVDAVAVAEARDLLVLQPEKDAYRIARFEAFANVGLKAIRKACYESGVEKLDGVLNLIDTLKAPASGTLPGLERELGALKGLI